MAGEHYLTRSHEVIRRWADAHGARPSTVAGTHIADDPGVIRFSFPDHPGVDRLESIDWDEWFAKFDASELVLMYAETAPDGGTAAFYRLLESDAAADSAMRAKWVDEAPSISP